VEYRKLLGRFVDICEAIAFAHSTGVLHRDLKPQNAMLGRYGETLVIDWGLARATGRAPVGPEAAYEATLVPPSGSGPAPTLSVLGSPPYMSLDQAAGAVGSLGPATDVYGLGAILFVLLTGESPVEGGSAEEVLDRVRQDAIQSPRSLNPNILRPLEAVCLKQPGKVGPIAKSAPLSIARAAPPARPPSLSRFPRSAQKTCPSLSPSRKARYGMRSFSSARSFAVL
jgi:serine/threonine protein kinase